MEAADRSLPTIGEKRANRGYPCPDWLSWYPPLSRRIPKKPLSSIDLTALIPFDLTTDEEALLEHGIALFNARKFWEAHEAWEEIWKNRPEDGRFFIQALIQLAAAYHQLGKKVYRGVLIHLKQAQERLKLFPSDFLGIDVLPILQIIDDSLAAIEARPNLAEVDWAAALKIACIQRRAPTPP